MSATAATLTAPDLRALPRERWAGALTDFYRSGLTGFLDIEVLDVEPGRLEARVVLRDELMRQAGEIVHAGTVVTLADSVAGWGCLTSLPDGVGAFVTGELKVNLVASARQPDALTACARMLHGGRTTQLWDVTVARESDGRAIAHFRCTQHLLQAG
jgi:1,4-dihydroxy-2-naphthoyl-CoA hydrolase